MSVYSDFQKIAKVIDCRKFIEEINDLMEYMKSNSSKFEAKYDDVFDLMAMFSGSGLYNLKDFAHKLTKNNWSVDVWDKIELKVCLLVTKFHLILNSLQKKMNVSVDFRYNVEKRRSYFRLQTSQVFDLVLELNKIKSVGSK